jgi:hypothetical protein
MEKFITSGNEGSPEALKFKYQTQKDLINKYYGFEPGNDEKIKWIETYSEKFHQIFDRMIKDDPHFLLHDQQTHNATLDLFEQELYAEEGTLDAQKVAEDYESK